MTLRAHLESLNACPDALAWVGDRDLATAWSECPRGDWLLWYAERAGVPRERVVLAACACARLAMRQASEGKPWLALRYDPADDPRPLRTVETVEAWARGEASLDEVREASFDASLAAISAATKNAYFEAPADIGGRLRRINPIHKVYWDVRAASAAHWAASSAYDSYYDAASRAAAMVYMPDACADAVRAVVDCPKEKP